MSTNSLQVTPNQAGGKKKEARGMQTGIEIVCMCRWQDPMQRNLQTQTQTYTHTRTHAHTRVHTHAHLSIPT